MHDLRSIRLCHCSTEVGYIPQVEGVPDGHRDPQLIFPDRYIPGRHTATYIYLPLNVQLKRGSKHWKCHGLLFSCSLLQMYINIKKTNKEYVHLKMTMCSLFFF